MKSASRKPRDRNTGSRGKSSRSTGSSGMPPTVATLNKQRIWSFCLVALAGISGALSVWFAFESWRTYQERKTTNVIRTLGGYVKWRSEESSPTGAKRWVQSVLGGDFMNRVVVVRLADTSADDEDLKRIGALTELRALDLRNTRITDAGIRHLTGLRRLKLLVLTSTEITDAGLRHTTDLAQLQVLSLEETRITDAGIAELPRLKNLAWLDLSQTDITDGALEPLARLRQLEALVVQGTDLTEVGVARLFEAMPRTRVFDTENRAPFFNFSLE